MAHRYHVPEHTSAVFAPSGEFRADENGVIELPDDAPDSAHDALRRAACVPEGAQAPVAAAEVDEAPQPPETGSDGDAATKAKSKN